MKKAKKLALAMLASSVALSIFSGTAMGASTRYALVTDITGTVKVTKAGGTKEIKVFNGMGLNEGDKLKVGKGSSLTVKIADTDDEVVLSENWSGAVSKLKTSAGGGSETALKAWSGAMYSNVRKITGSSDTYKVETPTAVMGVRGTHFTLVLNSDGTTRMFVHAGVVKASDSVEKEAKDEGPVILPAQMIELYSGVDNSELELGISYSDLEKLASEADPEVLKKILLNKAEIDEENDEEIPELPTQIEEGSTLKLADEETKEKYKEIVDNALFHLLNATINLDKLPSDEAKKVIEEANKKIATDQKQYDLNREVPPIDPLIGLDPELEEDRLLRQALLREQQEQAARMKEEKKKEYDQDLIEQIKDQMEQVQIINEQEEAKLKQVAIDKVFYSAPKDEQEELLEELKSTNSTPTPIPSNNTDTVSTPVAVPTVTVTKQNEDANSFDIVIDLANFTGSNSVYGAQLHFVHDQSSDYQPLVSPDSYYNDLKFTSTSTAESIRSVDGVVDTLAKTETIYAMTAFGSSGAPASFSGSDRFVTIPFTYTGSGSIKLEYLQLVKSDGTTISVPYTFESTYGPTSS